MNKHCFRPVWYVGQKALFLTRALLLPFPTWVDYRLYWNTPEKRSKRRVNVLEWQLGSHSHPEKGRGELEKERNRDSHPNPKYPTLRKCPFAQGTCYIFQKGFIWFWLNNYQVFSWESFNVKLDGKQELSCVFNFSEPRFPLSVSKAATTVLFYTESRNRELFNDLVKLVSIFWVLIPVSSTAIC